jgi:hypothetical protein
VWVLPRYQLEADCVESDLALVTAECDDGTAEMALTNTHTRSA